MIKAWAIAPQAINSRQKADWIMNLHSPDEKVWLAQHLSVWCLSADRIDPAQLTLPWTGAVDVSIFWISSEIEAPKNSLRRLNRSMTVQGQPVRSPWYIPDYLALCLQSPQSASWWAGIEAISIRRLNAWETEHRSVATVQGSGLTESSGPLCPAFSEGGPGHLALHGLAALLHCQVLSQAMAQVGLSTEIDLQLLQQNWLTLATANPLTSAHDVAASLLCHRYLETSQRTILPLHLWTPPLLKQALMLPQGRFDSVTQAMALLQGLQLVHRQFAAMGVALDVLDVGGHAINWADWLMDADNLAHRPTVFVLEGLVGSTRGVPVNLSGLPHVPEAAAALLQRAASPQYLSAHPILTTWPVHTSSDGQRQYPLSHVQVVDDRVRQVQIRWQEGAPVMQCGPAGEETCRPLSCILNEPLRPETWLNTGSGTLMVDSTLQAHCESFGHRIQAHAHLQGQWQQSSTTSEIEWQWRVEHRLISGPDSATDRIGFLALQVAVGTQPIELRLNITPVSETAESGHTRCSVDQLLPGQAFWSHKLEWPIVLQLASVRKPGWPEWRLWEQQAGSLSVSLHLQRDQAGDVQACAGLVYRPPVIALVAWQPWHGEIIHHLTLGCEQTLQRWESTLG